MIHAERWNGRAKLCRARTGTAFSAYRGHDKSLAAALKLCDVLRRRIIDILAGLAYIHLAAGKP